MTWLAVLSLVAVVAFFGMLAIFLRLIIGALDAIGGRGDSFLSRLRFGLRAIEVETGHMPGQVTQLNAGLAAIAEGLKAVDEGLKGTAAAAIRQGGR